LDAASEYLAMNVADQRNTSEVVEEQTVRSWIRSKLFHIAAVGVLCVFALAACGGQTADQPPTRAQTVSTPVHPAASATASSATVAVATPSVSPGTPLPSTTSNPGVSANASITPREVTVAGVTLDLSLDPARHMFDGAATTSALGVPQQPTPQSSAGNGSSSAVSAVFAGGMVGVTNNIDPSQPPPADSAESIVRHVVVHVKTKTDGQSIPYLNVTMDLLLDGHPVLYDQALEPMTTADKSSLQYYYGNNVKFPQPGTYQVFIRIQPNPILGNNPPQAAQFDVILH
jgi:hypothetical protein